MSEHSAHFDQAVSLLRDGTARPSVAGLQEAITGLSKSQAQELMRELEEAGVVTPYENGSREVIAEEPEDALPGDGEREEAPEVEPDRLAAVAAAEAGLESAFAGTPEPEIYAATVLTAKSDTECLFGETIPARDEYLAADRGLVCLEHANSAIPLPD